MKIIVICGGNSSEKEISVKTALSENDFDRFLTSIIKVMPLKYNLDTIWQYRKPQQQLL